MGFFLDREKIVSAILGPVRYFLLESPNGSMLEVLALASRSSDRS